MCEAAECPFPCVANVHVMCGRACVRACVRACLFAQTRMIGQAKKTTVVIGAGTSPRNKMVTDLTTDSDMPRARPAARLVAPVTAPQPCRESEEEWEVWEEEDS